MLQHTCNICKILNSLPAATDYMKTNLRADLAVLELQTSVLNLYNVNRVCLPGELQYANILDCEVAGWAGMLPTKV